MHTECPYLHHTLQNLEVVQVLCAEALRCIFGDPSQLLNIEHVAPTGALQSLCIPQLLHTLSKGDLGNGWGKHWRGLGADSLWLGVGLRVPTVWCEGGVRKGVVRRSGGKSEEGVSGGQ
jgi:hypothetical protein